MDQQPQIVNTTQSKDPDSAGLIRMIAGGDQSALTTLYGHTNRLVFGLVLRVVGDHSVAEEVLLDVYTQVWRQAAAYDPARGSPLAWITTIARTRAIGRLRSGRFEMERLETLDAAEDEVSKIGDPELTTADSEQRKLVRAAIESLAAEQKQVIELAYYSGLSHTEIAAKVGQPLGTVKNRVRLGMMKLSELLRPAFGGQG